MQLDYAVDVAQKIKPLNQRTLAIRGSKTVLLSPVLQVWIELLHHI